MTLTYSEETNTWRAKWREGAKWFETDTVINGIVNGPRNGVLSGSGTHGKDEWTVTGKIANGRIVEMVNTFKKDGQKSFIKGIYDAENKVITGVGSVDGFRLSFELEEVV